MILYNRHNYNTLAYTTFFFLMSSLHSQMSIQQYKLSMKSTKSKS